MAKAKKRVAMPFEQPGCLAVSPNGAHLVATDKFGGILWQLDGDLTLTEQPRVPGRIASVAVDDLGRVAIGWDSEAAIERRSSGDGAPGGSFVEVRDRSGACLQRAELANTAYAQVSWSPSGDAALFYDERPFVGRLGVADGLVEAVPVPTGARSVVACYCGGALLLASPGSLVALGPDGRPSGPATDPGEVFGDLVPAGPDLALMVSWGGGPWRTFDPSGALVGSGPRQMLGCGDGDGVAFASGRHVVRCDRFGAERGKIEAKGPVLGLGSGGGRLFGLVGASKCAVVELADRVADGADRG